MHENRETLLPTARVSGSPAGEGESRTSGMHGSEESDHAVVPMKPSNKATGKSPAAAEMVEGRARTKENVQQARAVPAQDGAAASQGLKGVRKAARERKQERFTTLLHHLTVDMLRDSHYALKREAAPGVDAREVGGIRRRTGTTAERSARTGAPGQLPGAAVTADLSAETGRSAEADRHRGAGRQNRTASGGDDPQRHIRGGFPGFQLRIPAGAEPTGAVSYTHLTLPTI